MKHAPLSAALTISAAALTFFISGNAGGAQAAPDHNQVCPGEHIHPADPTKSVTVTADEGQVITGYCVKAGSANQDNGPESFYGLSNEKVTISHSSGKDISHYVVFYGDKPPTTVPPVEPPVEETPAVGTFVWDCVEGEQVLGWTVAAGSVDADYMVRVKHGGGMLASGTVEADGNARGTLSPALEAGTVVVLRVNGDAIKFTMVPTPCEKPVEPPVTTVPPVEPPAPPVEPPVTIVGVTEAPEEEPPLGVRQSLGAANDSTANFPPATRAGTATPSPLVGSYSVGTVLRAL